MIRSRQASSADGRTFRIDGQDGVPTTPGDLLVADGVLLQAVRPDGGLVIGALGSGRVSSDVAPFAGAEARDATAEEMASFQAASGAGLAIGTWSSGAVEAAAALRASGFNRHTFLCGQSGSGKTYALGVLLEQLLLGTGLRMVVLDPNADFVRLSQTRPGADPGAAARIAATDIRVLGARPPAEPLRMRFSAMPRAAQAAVLRLDPLRDRGEYSLFVNAFGEDRSIPADVGDYLTELLAGGDDERALGQRMQNLGLHEWEVWARQDASVAEIVQGDARATVADLAGFEDPRESSAVCLDLVESLWASRHARRPVLIVIDEAHNVCPAEPVGEVQERLVERLVQVAAEGRKYGLWLLLSTQRPSKVHAQVVSQCDNLMLMRMNSPADVADIADLFGFAPAAMVAQAPYFRQGEAVLAGRFAACPMRGYFLRPGPRAAGATGR